MLKTPEEYLSDLIFDPPLSENKNEVLNSSERVFVEKYLGFDMLDAMPAVSPERVYPTLPVLNYEKPAFPIIEVVKEAPQDIEKTINKVEILERSKPVQIVVVPDEPLIETALLDKEEITIEATTIETEVHEKIEQDVVQKVIADLKEDIKQDAIPVAKIELAEEANEDVFPNVIAETIVDTVTQTQEKLVASDVNKILTPVELAVQATSSMREKLKALTEVQIFSFCIAEQVFLLPVPCIQEVIKYTELVKVPQAPTFIAGAINLRGNVIPLIFLSALLTNNTEHFYDESKFIIVCGTEQTKMGLIVDKINGMHFLQQNKIIWNAETKIGDAGEYLYAIANFNDRVCGLVAPELIMQKILES